MLDWERMDIAHVIAERKIAEALENGYFNALPACGRIDCSLSGELFVAKWWREKIMREERAREQQKTSR